MVKEEGLEKWTALEERIRAIEGNHLCDLVKAVNMCLVPNIVIPKKFRVPEFIKYTTIQCNIMADIGNREREKREREKRERVVLLELHLLRPPLDCSHF